MTLGKDTHLELQLLTDKLSEGQDAILKQWEHKMSELSRKSSALASMSQKEFQNDIPKFLERFNNGLINPGVTISDIGKAHGSQRWEHGFDLLHTVKEWGVLQKVLMAEITTLWKDLNLSPATLTQVYTALNKHIQEGIEYSVREFNMLQRRETETQLRDVEKILQNSKNMSRDNNLRDTSHDLKGLVKNLQMGFFLLEDEPISEKAADLINQMALAADSLEKLLNDLLDLFRLETNREKVNLSEFNAAKILAELCESIQPLVKKEKHELTCSGIDSLPVKSDQTKLQRIARNLLLNALKYTKEGHIDVRWEKISDREWLLEISDTGPGLNATHVESLTIEEEASETEERKKAPDQHPVFGEVQKQGEGIGLLIVRHLCKLLDAIIEVDAEPGEGTSFKIIFPVSLTSETTRK